MELDGSKVVAGFAENKFLIFALGGEEYGVDVLRVREIIGMIYITRVPRSPAFVKGVINLRGKVVPVVDLRARFELPEREFTDRTCIIVVEVPGQSGMILMGIIVDAVSEVLSISSKDVEPPPTFGVQADTSCFLGMAKLKGSVKTLLDIGRVLTGDMAVRLNELSAAME